MAEDLGHYPYQVGLDAYGNGGFRFAEMSHRGSLLCLPSGMHGWSVNAPGEVTLESLAPVFACKDDLDVLMIGMGQDIAPLDPAIRAACREAGIIVEAISTGSAVRTYNILLAERRAIGAALIAVDRAR